MTQFYLQEVSTGEELELLSQDETIVGRLEGDHTFPHDKKLSRQHVKFVVENERPTIQDLGSTNGVLLNGELIKKNIPYVVKINDEITFGSMEFVLKKVDEKTLKEKTRIDLNAAPPPTEELKLPGQNYYYFKKNEKASLLAFYLMWFFINIGALIALQNTGLKEYAREIVFYTSPIMLFMFIVKFIQNSTFNNAPLISNLKISYIFGNYIAMVVISFLLGFVLTLVPQLIYVDGKMPTTITEIKALGTSLFISTIVFHICLSWFYLILDIGIFRYFLITIDHPNFKITMNKNYNSHRENLKQEHIKLLFSCFILLPRYLYYYDQFMLKSFKINGHSLFSKNKLQDYWKNCLMLFLGVVGIIILWFLAVWYFQSYFMMFILVPVSVYSFYIIHYKLYYFRLKSIQIQNMHLDIQMDKKSYLKLYWWLIGAYIASLGSWVFIGYNFVLFYLMMDKIKISTDYDLSRDYDEENIPFDPYEDSPFPVANK